MRNLKLAFRTLFKTPFVTIVAISRWRSASARTRRSSRCSTRCCCRRCRCREPERLVNLAAPGPKPGSTVCSQAGDCDEVFSYPMFRDLEKAQTAFSGIAAHRDLRRERRLPRPDAERRRRCSSRARTSRCSACSRRSAGCFTPERRPDHRRTLRRRAELRLLADAASARDPNVLNEQDHRQRPDDDDRRRRAEGFDGTTLGVAAGRVRADHDARHDEPGFERLRQPPQLLGLSVRAPQARRDDRAGARPRSPSTSRSSTTSKRRCRRA